MQQQYEATTKALYAYNNAKVSNSMQYRMSCVFSDICTLGLFTMKQPRRIRTVPVCINYKGNICTCNVQRRPDKSKKGKVPV